MTFIHKLYREENGTLWYFCLYFTGRRHLDFNFNPEFSIGNEEANKFDKC